MTSGTGSAQLSRMTGVCLARYLLLWIRLFAQVIITGNNNYSRLCRCRPRYFVHVFSVGTASIIAHNNTCITLKNLCCTYEQKLSSCSNIVDAGRPRTHTHTQYRRRSWNSRTKKMMVSGCHSAGVAKVCISFYVMTQWMPYTIKKCWIAILQLTAVLYASSSFSRTLFQLIRQNQPLWFNMLPLLWGIKIYNIYNFIHHEW